MSNDVIHPENEIADHVEELEQVVGVSQFDAPGVDHQIQVLPGVDHLSLPVLDLALLVSSITCLQSVGVLLYGLHLEHTYTTDQN